MSFIRYHQLTGLPIIFAPKRGLRPHDFKTKCKKGINNGNCPFCEGNEHITPPEVLALPPKKQANCKGWKVRIVPNKYSALSSKCQPEEIKNQYLEKNKRAYGYHEVIITQPHDCSLADLTPKLSDLNWQACTERIKRIPQDKKIKYVQLIYNHGATAGASLAHPHAQLFAMDFVPPLLEQENKTFVVFNKKEKKNLMEEIIKKEIKGKTRVLKESKNFLAWCPYGSRSNFEIWIAPKKKCSFTRLNEAKRKEYAVLVQKTFKMLKDKLFDPDFNFYLHVNPVNIGKKYDHFHWHLEILPKISTWAGFELGTDVIINTVLPEDAAKMLRG